MSTNRLPIFADFRVWRAVLSTAAVFVLVGGRTGLGCDDVLRTLASPLFRQPRQAIRQMLEVTGSPTSPADRARLSRVEKWVKKAQHAWFENRQFDYWQKALVELRNQAKESGIQVYVGFTGITILPSNDPTAHPMNVLAAELRDLFGIDVRISPEKYPVKGQGQLLGRTAYLGIETIPYGRVTHAGYHEIVHALVDKSILRDGSPGTLGMLAVENGNLLSGWYDRVATASEFVTMPLDLKLLAQKLERGGDKKALKQTLTEIAETVNMLSGVLGNFKPKLQEKLSEPSAGSKRISTEGNRYNYHLDLPSGARLDFEIHVDGLGPLPEQERWAKVEAEAHAQVVKLHEVVTELAPLVDQIARTCRMAEKDANARKKLGPLLRRPLRVVSKHFIPLRTPRDAAAASRTGL